MPVTSDCAFSKIKRPNRRGEENMSRCASAHNYNMLGVFENYMQYKENKLNSLNHQRPLRHHENDYIDREMPQLESDSQQHYFRRRPEHDLKQPPVSPHHEPTRLQRKPEHKIPDPCAEEGNAKRECQKMEYKDTTGTIHAETHDDGADDEEDGFVEEIVEEDRGEKTTNRSGGYEPPFKLGVLLTHFGDCGSKMPSMK